MKLNGTWDHVDKWTWKCCIDNDAIKKLLNGTRKLTQCQCWEKLQNKFVSFWRNSGTWMTIAACIFVDVMEIQILSNGITSINNFTESTFSGLTSTVDKYPLRRAVSYRDNFTWAMKVSGIQYLLHFIYRLNLQPRGHPWIINHCYH